MAATPPNAVLRGGPEYLSDSDRVRHIENLEMELKLLVGNRYEHFVPTGEEVAAGRRRLRVFEWTNRTFIAE
jgi:hypothetical protein